MTSLRTRITKIGPMEHRTKKTSVCYAGQESSAIQGQTPLFRTGRRANACFSSKQEGKMLPCWWFHYNSMNLNYF